jgi:hypothetical protein
MFQEAEAPRISRQSANECDKVVSPTHWPSLSPENIPGTHFCYRLSSPLGHSQCKIAMTTSGIEPATFRLVVQCLNQLLHRVPPTRIVWNRKFITALTKICYLSLSWARAIQSMLPHPTSWRSVFNIILLCTHRSSTWSLSLKSLHQTLYAPLRSPIRATCPAHLILLFLITRIIFDDEYRS